MALTLLNLEAARREMLRATAPQAMVKEALAPQLFSLLAADAEDAKFRRITSPATLRDLNPLMQERMQQVAFFLSVTTPFGKRIVEIITSYVVGEGFQASSDDPEIDEAIRRFWEDGVNDLGKNLRAWCRELNVFGELCLPVAVNPVNGFVRVGYIDPTEIDAVEFGALDTGAGREISIPVAVKFRQRIGETAGRRLGIIRREEDVNSPDFGRLTGDCFYFAINKAKSASRGISELFALADWIDVFDQMVFDFADKVRFLNAFVWHYTVKGGDEKLVDKVREKVTKSPPRQGGVQVTNDQIEIEARTPDLKGADMHEAARLVKLYGLGGAGLPAWFFADPVDANRSTAIEMEGPTGKKLTDKQNELKEVVRAILEFVLEQAQAHGVIAPGAILDYRLDVPDLSIKDIAKAAGSLPSSASALSMAEDRGWVQSKTAARAFYVLLEQMGVEVDDDEFELAQAEASQREAAEIDRLAPQRELAERLKALPPASQEVQ